MGLTDKLFKKDDKKPEREVGSNFEKSEADKIFDALDNVEAKKKSDIPENLKKEINQTKEVSAVISANNSALADFKAMFDYIRCSFRGQFREYEGNDPC